MDEGKPVPGEPVRWVTARELARCAGDLLDEVAAEGSTVLVTRHGRPAALLAPVPRGAGARWIPRRVRKPGPEPVAVTDDAADTDELRTIELDPFQRRILASVAERVPLVPSPGEPTERWAKLAGIALLRLELEGLVDGGRGAYRVTAKGARLARVLSAGGDPVRDPSDPARDPSDPARSDDGALSRA